jgi:rubrerythrin
MSTTNSVLTLIDQCHFSSENPFEISESLFPVLDTIANPAMTALFEKNCYNSWLIYGFDGESQVTIFYDSILQKLQDGSLDDYYGQLSLDDQKQIQDRFATVIHDESEHREIFKAIIEKIQDADKKEYHPDYFNPACQEYADSQWKLWDYYTLMESLGSIAVAESYLLSAFVLFYKYSKNPIKQQIFKKFIQDESKHIAHFMNCIKKAKVSDSERQKYQAAVMYHTASKLNFEQTNFELMLDSLIKDSNKKRLIMTMAYRTNLQKTFRKIFIKKAWQFYSLVVPGIEQDAFEQQVQEYKLNSECASSTSLLNHTATIRAFQYIPDAA